MGGGNPMVVAFGSYLPGWIPCAAAGILFAALAHLLLRKARIVEVIPLATLFDLMLVGVGTLGSWLWFFGDPIQ